MSQDNHLDGKVIVITGAASGFGQLVSEKAAAKGASIVASDVNQEALDTVVAGIRAAGGAAIAVAADVTDRAQMQMLAEEAVAEFGAIDVMLNNAGIMPLAFYADHKNAADAWEKCIDINFKGVLNGITAVYDQMISQGRGHVINISSIYGNYPTAGGGVYGATKAAVVFLSESLRIESQGKIKVTTVRPTGVPATNLGTGIVNPEAVSGLLGVNTVDTMSKFEAAAAGQMPAQMLDRNEIEYFALEPDLLADQIIHAMNQPWGVAISDITVRASGDGYVI
jgi:NADP-dependent 3-hydroxy acid dehydrogenase YdfG